MLSNSKGVREYFHFDEMKKFKKLVRSKVLRYRRNTLRVLSFLILLLTAFMLYRSGLNLSKRLATENKLYGGDEDYRMRMVLKRAAYRNTVLVTTSNYMYREQLRNFQCSLNRLDLPYDPVVFSLDRNTHEFAMNHSFASVLLSDEEGDDVRPGKFQENGTRSFGSITRNKFDAVLAVLDFGLDVIISDADIHWCSDALSTLLEMHEDDSEADIKVMAEPEYKTLNSGFYFVRSNKKTRELFNVMKSKVEFGNHDQDVLNAVFCNNSFGARRIMNSKSVVPYHCVTRNGVTVKVLDSNQWPSGGQTVSGRPIFSHTRETIQEMCDTKQTFVIHNNFVTAKKKKARMVVKGMWYLESEETMKCLDYPMDSDRKYVRTCGIYCQEREIGESNTKTENLALNEDMSQARKVGDENRTGEAKYHQNFLDLSGNENQKEPSDNIEDSLEHLKVLNDVDVDDILHESSFNGSVLITISNYMYRGQLRNFQCSLKRLQLPYSLVVFALDRDTHNFSTTKGMRSILISSENGLDTGMGKFEKTGPRSFGYITRKKLLAVYKVLRTGLNVLVSDADIHWCGDAVKIIQNLDGEAQNADIIIMPEMDYKTLNSGFYYVRANKRTKETFELIMDNYEIGNHDQDVINEVLCGSRFGSEKIYSPEGNGSFYCKTKSGAIVYLLDADKWPSGGQNIDGISVFLHPRSRLIRMCNRNRFYVIHNNYVSASRKEFRMIVKGMWFVDDSQEMNCLAEPAPVTKKARSRCSTSCSDARSSLIEKISYGEEELKMIENSSYNNVALITTANYMYRTHLRNFQCALSRLHLPYVPLVLSQDKKTHEFCNSKGLKSILITPEIGEDIEPGNFTKFGHRSFSFITRLKFKAVRYALESNKDILFSDADIHWCVDAVEALLNLGEPYHLADIVVMPEAQYSQLNSGFYFVRSNSRTKSLFEEMMKAAELGNHDQDVFNAFLCGEKFHARKVESQNHDVPFSCITRNNVVVRILPSTKWPSGNEIVNGVPIFKNTRRQLTEMCNSGAFNVVHNNYIKAKLKEVRMIVKGMWFYKSNDHMTCTKRAVIATDESRRSCGKYCK